ncbi:hypothetical protein KQX54_013312 [Cotesia glomerata]|uniref:Uncharacterized protein n=1 Tax=Cotesia glomerata TaxID=32391 RepID=A0AAV7I9C5_COTGL|nr:hypothetical protein KQX54_013312 [Cotesia glomerata]
MHLSKKKLTDLKFELLVTPFEDNAIDEEVLNELDKNLIDNLIPQVGWRHKFKKRYQLFKAEMADDVEKESDMLVAINASSNNESEHVLDVEEPGASTSTTPTENPREKCTLFQFLKSSKRGRLIFNIYEKDKTVNRSKLLH